MSTRLVSRCEAETLLRYARCALLLLPALLLTACALFAPPPAAPPPAPPPPAPVVAPPQPDPNLAEIRRLLAEADLALGEDRLMTPPEDCAYSRYVRVLYLDPANMEARNGIGDIVERYLDWALQEAQSRHFGSARAHLESARSIDASAPNVAAVERQIDELQNARTRVYKLPPAGLQRRTADVVATLRRIGLEIGNGDASVIITARTDEEGRWIYQQLNDLSGRRVRAQLEIGSPPSVEVLSLPTPTPRSQSR